MSSPLPATKLPEYAAKLTNLTQPLSELEIRRMLEELKRAKKSLPGEYLDIIYGLIGAANKRLRKYDDALAAHRAADSIHPTAETKANLGGVLLDMGRMVEAVGCLAEAAELDDKNIVVLVNLCQVLVNLNSIEDARAVYARAVDVADFHNPEVLFYLATMASITGAEVEAVELFARFLALKQGVSLGMDSAIEFIQNSPDELKYGLVHMPGLARAIERVTTLGAEVERLAMLPPGAVPVPEIDPGGETGETEDEVFAWTQPYRDRANAAAFKDHGDG